MENDIMKLIDDFDKEIQSKQLMMESLVVTGQRMAILLGWFCHEFGGIDTMIDAKCSEAKELIIRWEKEFK